MQATFCKMFSAEESEDSVEDGMNNYKYSGWNDCPSTFIASRTCDIVDRSDIYGKIILLVSGPQLRVQ